MNARCDSRQKAMAFFCVLLILAYTLTFLLPHAHACQDPNCAVCALLESYKDISWLTTLCVTLVYHADQAESIPRATKEQLSHNNSLVAQAVKLSN